MAFKKIGLVLLVAGTVAACSTTDTSDNAATPASTTPPTVSSSATNATSSVATSTETTAITSSESTKRAPSGTTTSTSTANTAVELTRERFQSLAPASLFDQFDTCSPNGVENSMACSGAEVGQFQFFDSDAKAASTTQLLTGLRNSRVITDTGRFVVGWSTLGNTAIITVVDNDEGLVLQQMVSTDEVDPTERIYELGLAEETEPSSAAAAANSRDARPSSSATQKS